MSVKRAYEAWEHYCLLFAPTKPEMVTVDFHWPTRSYHFALRMLCSGESKVAERHIAAEKVHEAADVEGFLFQVWRDMHEELSPDDTIPMRFAPETDPVLEAAAARVVELWRDDELGARAEWFRYMREAINALDAALKRKDDRGPA